MSANIKCPLHIARNPTKWIKLDEQFRVSDGELITKETKLRALKPQLICATSTSIDDFENIAYAMVSIASKGSTIILSYSGHITSRLVPVLSLIAQMSASFELVLPEAGDDIWVVGKSITPPSNLREIIAYPRRSVVVGDDFVKFVADFSTTASELRAEKNKLIELLVDKYQHLSGSSISPTIITDDLTQEYKVKIAEVSQRWSNRFLKV